MKALRAALMILCLLIPAAAAAANDSPTLAGPCAPGPVYDPACDVDHDGDVDILDIQLAAGHWNRSGTWTGGGDGWSLTGNAGTNAASNFLGTVDNQPLVVKINGQRALLLRPASDPTQAPSVIAGYAGNTTSAGVWGATVAGGGSQPDINDVSDHYGAIGGGAGNLAGDGDQTPDDAQYATVGGGGYNAASDRFATVGGGIDNTASDESATVGGGGYNAASGVGSTVGGGLNNTASDDYAIVGGGYGNISAGNGSIVPGGFSNEASGSYSFAAGRRAKALADGSFVWADSQNSDFTAATPNQFLIRAAGGGYFEGNNIGYALLAFNDNALGHGLRAATDGTYAGYFEDDIFVAGQCTGCLLAYVAVNSGGEALAVGDLVAPAGLGAPLVGSGTEVLQVQRAEAGQGVIGVVTTRAALHSAAVTPAGATEQVAERTGGAIQPEDYLFIAVQGLARVRIAAGETVVPGQRLAAAGAGQARGLRQVQIAGVAVDESAPTLGIAVDAPDPITGLAPVMVSLR